MKSPNIYYGSLDSDEHGGGCCGIHHLYNFGDEDDFERKPTLTDKMAVISNRIRWEETTEVVLTRQQATVWERALQRCGFKKVMEFSNPNTNNILRMYLSTNNQVKPTKKRSLA